MDPAPPHDARQPPDTADPAFAEACERAGVEPRHRLPLWGLLCRHPASRRDVKRAELLEDYAHWRLFEASREGDAAAARQFEQHWRRAIRAYFGRRFRRDEAEELAGVFFERVYRLVPVSFRWQCPFSAYLRAVVVNLSRDEAVRLGRRRGREADLDGDVRGADAFPSRAPTPETALLDDETAASVRAALAELTPADRHLLVACLLEGESGQELAAEMGITRDALYQRLRRSKQRLKKLLADRGLT